MMGMSALTPADSPFHKGMEEKRLHCDLLRHNPLMPCPHHKIPLGEKASCSVANDCGGGTGAPLLKTEFRPLFIPAGSFPDTPGLESDFQAASAGSVPTPTLSIATPPPELS